jgi:hypothetical protein
LLSDQLKLTKDQFFETIRPNLVVKEIRTDLGGGLVKVIFKIHNTGGALYSMTISEPKEKKITFDNTYIIPDIANDQIIRASYSYNFNDKDIKEFFVFNYQDRMGNKLSQRLVMTRNQAYFESTI